MTTTFDRIRAMIIRDFELPPERLQRDTLLEEIELDSLAITELVFQIEDEFKITAEDKIPPFKTLGDIADYVSRLVAERDAKPAPKRAAAKAKPASVTKARAAKPPRARAAITNGAGVVKPAVGTKRAARARVVDAPPRKPKRSSARGARAR
jgi:acyl carrier protein